jgi:DNA-binding MarR family transcriptional regulator
LTLTQRRVLSTVRRMQFSAEGCAHDAEGDLSLCSGNLTHTLRTLRRRGLIQPYEVREPDGYYTNVRLTPGGLAAFSETKPGPSKCRPPSSAEPETAEPSPNPPAGEESP